MAPLVSYVIPAYRHEAYIGQAIRSVLDQWVTDLELIVVDDCSPDRTFEVASAIRDTRLRVIRNERNLGNAATLNRGIEESRGRFVSQLGSDDFILPGKTASQLEMFERDPTLSIVGTWVEIVDRSNARHPAADALEKPINVHDDLNHLSRWCVRNNLAHSSTMVRRELHERIGLYEATMTRAPDWEFWIRSLRRGARIGLVPKKVTAYRLVSDSLTHGNPLGTMLEVAYLMSRHMIPLLYEKGLVHSLAAVVDWCIRHPAFTQLAMAERTRLLGLLTGERAFDSFAACEQWLRSEEPAQDPAGRLLATVHAASQADLDMFKNTVNRAEEIRTAWYEPRIRSLEQSLEELAQAARSYEAAIKSYEETRRDWFLPRIAHLEREIATMTESLQRYEQAAREYETAKRDWFEPRMKMFEDLANQRAAEIEMLAEAAETARQEADAARGRQESLAHQCAVLQTLLGRLLDGTAAMPGRPASGEDGETPEALGPIVAASGLFDADWYVARYPDVARAGGDPFAHYLAYGHLENRSPGPHFDAEAYLAEHPELIETGQPAILHYLAGNPR